MKNSYKGFVVPLLIVIVALAIGGSIYIYKNKLNEVPVIEEVVSQQTNTDNLKQISQNQTPVKKSTNSVSQNTSTKAATTQVCTSKIQPQESQSSEYASLVQHGWTFKTAILSDFNCNGKQDVLVVSSYSIKNDPAAVSYDFFKIGLKLFEGGTGSWKLITEQDSLGAPFEIHPLKMADGTNAAEITIPSQSIKAPIYLKDGFLFM